MPAVALGAEVRAPFGFRAAGLVLIPDRGERKLRGDLIAVADLEALSHVPAILRRTSDIDAPAARLLPDHPRPGRLPGRRVDVLDPDHPPAPRPIRAGRGEVGVGVLVVGLHSAETVDGRFSD